MQGGNLQACTGEGVFDCSLGLRLLILHHHATSREVDNLAGHLNLFSLRQESECGLKTFLWSSYDLLQFFFADPGHERILLLKIVQCVCDKRLQTFHSCSRDQNSADP